MAKLTNPLMSQDARGSVAGIQYSRNRSGNFGSRKSTSGHKQGDLVTNQRALIKHAHTAWENLSDTLKCAWESHAQWPMTARNAFVGAAIVNLTAKLNPPDASPLVRETHGPPYNFHYVKIHMPEMIPGLTWSQDPGDTRRIIVSIVRPSTTTLPHVRKFKHYREAAVAVTYTVFPSPWPPTYAAVRVRLVDDHAGTVDAEWRDYFDWDVDKALFGHEP